MPKLPNALVICASTLLCASVVALQNAELYASKMEEPVQALSDLLLALPENLRAVGGASHAVALNEFEKEQIKSLAAVISPETQASESDEDSDADEGGEESSAQLAAEPLSTEPDDAPIAGDEPLPEETHESQSAPALLTDETPETDAAGAEDAQEERETIPAPESRWWAQLSSRPAFPRTFFPTPQEAAATRVSYIALQPADAAVKAAPADAVEASSHEPAIQGADGESPEFAAAPPQAPDRNQAHDALAAVEAPASDENPADVMRDFISGEPLHMAAAAPSLAAGQGALPWHQQMSAEAVRASGLTEAPPVSCRIMMVGDSLMEDLGPRTYRALSKRKGLHFILSAKFSTGLCRPDFFNWPAHMSEVVSKQAPDIVIFFIGGNDGQAIREGKRMVTVGSSEWREAYGRRMDEVASIARGAGAEIIWVVLPAAGNRFAKSLRETQTAQREYCTAHNILHLVPDELFSGEWGKYSAFGTYKGKQVRLRRTDTVHLTSEGNMKLMDSLLPMIEQRLIAYYLTHPEKRLSEEQLAQIKTVPAEYTCLPARTKRKSTQNKSSKR